MSRPRTSTTPPEAWAPALRLARLAALPLERFLRVQAASGIVLLAAAAIALGLANSPWSASFAALWETPLGLRAGPFHVERSLGWVVNDGLMAIFFFVVGMEIRRELHQGELSEWRRATLPAAAALGGMIVPALFYLALAGAPPTRAGWGAPMATDIAFAIGVLALLGKRVPAALRVLLLALAVMDDLGAILVIAIFYSSGVSPAGLAVVAAGALGIFALRALGVRHKIAYILPAVVLWAGTYATGLHPTIAGVMVGLVTPVRAWLGEARKLEALARDVASAPADAHEVALRLRRLEVARREMLSPAEALIETLHPWVAFAIMPAFALANAGVSLEGVGLSGERGAVALAVSVGLVLGKPVGVLAFSALAVRTGLARLPAGLGARHLVVLGTVAGIGFTMSIFIAQLAFGDPALLGAAKLGVLIASGVAAVLALVLGRVLLSPVGPSAARTADEAEVETDR